MTLIEEAESAETIVKTLTTFLTPAPEHAQDINATISALTGLSWALRQVDRILGHDTSQLELIEPDLKLVHTSVCHTLADVYQIIGQIGNGSLTLYPEDFRKTWAEIVAYSSRMGRSSLSVRLDTYRRFLLALCLVLTRQPAVQEFRELQTNVRNLSLPYNGGGLIGEAPANGHDLRISRRLSYERRRSPNEPLSPAGSDNNRPRFPNPNINSPSPPTSPTTTFSSNSQNTSLEAEYTEHWAKVVFQDVSSTMLPVSHELSRYHDHAEHPLSSNPDDRYEEVIAMSFLPDIRAAFHCCSGNMAAKMTLTLPVPRGRRASTSLSLKRLYLIRSGCMLRFAHVGRDNRSLVPWVSLQFLTIERLILLALTFVAMRTASGASPEFPMKLWDDQNRDEIEEYRGVINDSRHRLELCIYRDRLSGAVRLQTTKRSGSKAGTPLWTAFVTHPIASPTWCQRTERNVVVLNELKLYIFKFNYEPERAHSGAYVLEFQSGSDTKAFLETVVRLRQLLLSGRAQR